MDEQLLHTCFKPGADESSLQAVFNNTPKMSIEAVWVIELLWILLMLAIFAREFLQFRKILVCYISNALRLLAYLTFPARIINQVSLKSLYSIDKVSISKQKILNSKIFTFLNKKFSFLNN